MVTDQLALDLAPPRVLKPTQQEVLEALRWLIVPGDTADIQRALAEHNIPREKSCIAKRLCELEALGLVTRLGRVADGKGIVRTKWKRS